MREFQNSKVLKEQDNLLIKEMGVCPTLSRECVPELFKVYIFKFAALEVEMELITSISVCINFRTVMVKLS